MSDERNLREDVLALMQAGLDAVDPTRLTVEYLEQREEEIAPRGRLVLLALGKAAAEMARGALSVLGPRIADGIVIAPTQHEIEGLRCFTGGHPYPNETGRAGAAAALELASGLGADDAMLALISGGGSALATLPAVGIPLDDLAAVTRILSDAGVDVLELNAVRKHLDQLKGGRLAQAAEPAHVIGLVLSDVVDDRLDIIASGPLTPARGTFEEAIAILERHDLWERMPNSVRSHLERGRDGELPPPPGDRDTCFREIEMHVVGNYATSIRAMRERAAEMGHRVLVQGTPLVGEAREVGADLGRMIRSIREQRSPVPPPVCLLSGGETAVTVRGRGLGGRNQELALAAAIEMDGVERVCLASVGTDGLDGPTDAAGALATGDTLARAREKGLDAVALLDDNDSHRFFGALGDLIRTGPTGTNVADFQIVLVC